MGLTRRRVLALPLGILAAGSVPGCGLGGPDIPDPHPGEAREVRRLPGQTMNIALTVDDGKDLATLQAYLNLANSAALPLTLCVTHVFAANWSAVADHLRSMVQSGRVQLVNHTWSHRDLTTLSDSEIKEEILRTEAWINETWGVTSRPYLRPPNGRWDQRVSRICGELGFTTILMRNASFEDSGPVASDRLLAQARRCIFPGALVLGHANSPTITGHFEDILASIRRQNLTPVTLDTAFGTSRALG